MRPISRIEELESIVLKALAPNSVTTGTRTGASWRLAISRALLTKQELVDATTLEAVISEFVVRENTRPGLSEVPPPMPQAEEPPANRTIAAAPMALVGGSAAAIAADSPAARRSPSAASLPEGGARGACVV